MIEPFIINLKKYNDHRGYFVEKFNKEIYNQSVNIDNKNILQNCPQWIQENYSVSNKHVLRGLHYQLNNPQAKLIHCIHGKIMDVIVDLRESSPNFGKHEKYYLDDSSILYVPIGFAHAFLSLSDNTIVEYKCSKFYLPKDSYTLMWNDKNLNIDWGIDDPILSSKDADGLSLADCPKFD